LSSLNIDPPKELLALALDAPYLADIYKSVLQLKQCGAFVVKVTDKNKRFFEEEDGDITTLGVIMSHLPIDIRMGKLVVMGHVYCERRFNRKRTKGADLAETQTELTKGFPDNEWLSRRHP
jgi:hypothetical protein